MSQTTKQRVAALRTRRKAQGFVRVELYVHPDDLQAIRELAAKLTLEKFAPVDNASGLQSKTE